MTIAIITAAALAAVLWPVVVANNVYLNTSDAGGNGLNAFFTIILTIGLWCLLSLAFLLTSLQGGIPRLHAMRSGTTRRRHPEVESQSKHDELKSRFNALTPHSPRRDHLPFVDPSLGRHDETVQRIRNLDHRQIDAEQMFREGNYDAFPRMWNFELSVTPALCKGSHRSPRHTRYRDMEMSVSSLESTLRWLSQNQCRMTDELNALEEAVNSYPRAASEGALFLAVIREARSDPAKTSVL